MVLAQKQPANYSRCLKRTILPRRASLRSKLTPICVHGSSCVSPLFVSRIASMLVRALALMLIKRSDACKPPRRWVWGCFRTARAPRGFLTSRWRCRQNRYLLHRPTGASLGTTCCCSVLQTALVLSKSLCICTAPDNLMTYIFSGFFLPFFRNSPLYPVCFPENSVILVEHIIPGDNTEGDAVVSVSWIRCSTSLMGLA